MGSFLGTLGKIAGGVVSVASAALSGGPVAALKAGVGAITGNAVPAKIQQQLGTRPSISSFAPGGFDLSNLGPSGGLPSVPTPGFYHGTLSRFLPGGESGYSAAPPGYHLNKRYLAYYRGSQMGKHLQDPTQRPQVVNPVVKNRRMNPLNPRALRHATQRMHGAVRLMRHVLSGSGYTIKRTGLGKSGRRRAGKGR